MPPTQNYPWGEDWDPSQEPWRANTLESDLGRSTAVGLYPAGASTSGILDLSGTLWEWCQNRFDPPEKVEVTIDAKHTRVLRGGSFSYDGRYCRAPFRLGSNPSNRDDDVGFRLLCLSPIIG